MQDVEALKYKYSFKEVMKLYEWIEMMGGFDMASAIDHDNEMKKINNK